MRIRLLGRRSDLAVLQTGLVARHLAERWPSLDIVQLTRSSAGDRDRRVNLSSVSEKGLFTSDLSQALVAGEADAAVHSWKDLPVASYPGTTLAATLERADPRDVLLVRRDVVAARPGTLSVLSSSPRRAWQLGRSLTRLLPWPVADLSIQAVRGNIPTRLTKLLARDGDALVVAKAALDRLLSDAAPADVRRTVRHALDACEWMVLPIKEFPTAPAQGAIAVEIPASRPDLAEWIGAINHEPTWRAVQAERHILASLGGGCHEAIGATALIRDYGQITSVSAHLDDAGDRHTWSLDPPAELPRPSSPAAIWPRPDERHLARRRPLDVALPAGADGLWIARAEALPAAERPASGQMVWSAGSRTWERLAARGVWVHGCADGLGDAERPNVDLLAGRQVRWHRLTHSGSSDPDAVATYAVDCDLPDDLGARTHFFWTSGSLFLQALGRQPSIGAGWHASGPGRTARVIRETLGQDARASVWLDYEQWLQSMTS